MGRFLEYLRLEWAELALMVAGAVLLAVTLAGWMRRGRDPLRGAPIRLNRLSLAVLWLAMTGYLLAAMMAVTVASWYAGPFGADAKVLELWRGIITANLSQVMVIVLMLVVGGRSFRAGLRGYGIGRQALGRDLCMGVSAALMAICVCTQLGRVVELFVHWIAPRVELPAHDVFVTLAVPQTPAWIRAGAVVGAFLLAPISEELFFRGILQTGLHRLLPPKPGSMRHRWVAVTLTAVLFGLMHMPTWQYVPALVVFGAILGYVYERSGSLVASIVVHMLFNAKTLAWYYIQHGGWH